MDLEALKDQWAQNEEVDGVRLRSVEHHNTKHNTVLVSRTFYEITRASPLDEKSLTVFLVYIV